MIWGIGKNNAHLKYIYIYIYILYPRPCSVILECSLYTQHKLWKDIRLCMARQTSGEAARKNLWHGAVLFTVPIDV